jgi:hypothetical protein
MRARGVEHSEMVLSAAARADIDSTPLPTPNSSGDRHRRQQSGEFAASAVEQSLFELDTAQMRILEPSLIFVHHEGSRQRSEAL